jgi:hypothetical protein
MLLSLRDQHWDAFLARHVMDSNLDFFVINKSAKTSTVIEVIRIVNGDR